MLHPQVCACTARTSRVCITDRLTRSNPGDESGVLTQRCACQGIVGTAFAYRQARAVLAAHTVSAGHVIPCEYHEVHQHGILHSLSTQLCSHCSAWFAWLIANEACHRPGGSASAARWKATSAAETFARVKSKDAFWSRVRYVPPEVWSKSYCIFTAAVVNRTLYPFAFGDF
eukprot:1416572-Amphidinium_carterae.1